MHADIKPTNILIDARGQARLSDLDVSVDGATRTSAAHATRTSLAFSAGFTAPEVATQGSSYASDLFSVGMTAASEPVKTACLPSNQAGEGQDEGYDENTAGVEAFVQALTAPAPAGRPTARAAQQHAFFSAARRGRKQTEGTRKCCVKASERCLELKVHPPAPYPALPRLEFTDILS